MLVLVTGLVGVLVAVAGDDGPGDVARDTTATVDYGTGRRPLPSVPREDFGRAWTYENTTGHDPYYAAQVGDTIVLHFTDGGDDDPGTLVGLTLDGDERWQVEVGEGSYVGAEVPGAGEGGVVVLDDSDGSTAYDVLTGEELWNRDASTYGNLGDDVLQYADGETQRVGGLDGEVRWSAEGFHDGVVGDDEVEGLLLVDGAVLRRVDPDTGEEEWSHSHYLGTGEAVRVRAGVNGDLVVVSGFHAVVGLDARTGEQVFSEDGDHVVGRVAPAPDGRLAVVEVTDDDVGTTPTGSTEQQVRVTAYDRDGAVAEATSTGPTIFPRLVRGAAGEFLVDDRGDHVWDADLHDVVDLGDDRDAVEVDAYAEGVMVSDADRVEIRAWDTDEVLRAKDIPVGDDGLVHPLDGVVLVVTDEAVTLYR